MPTVPDKLKDAINQFRTKLRTLPLVASVVSTSVGRDPAGGAELGILVLFHSANPAECVKELASVAKETAPGVPLYTVESAPAKPL
jgi:hypothetical protein